MRVTLDMLHNRPAAWAEGRSLTRAWISRMTWIEVMSAVPDEASKETEEFLRLFAMCEIDEEIGRCAAAQTAKIARCDNLGFGAGFRSNIGCKKYKGLPC